MVGVRRSVERQLGFQPESRIPVFHPPYVRPRIVVDPTLRPSLNITDQWSEFASYRDVAACEVLIVPDLCTWNLWDTFVAHQRTYELTPRILVTTPNPESLRYTIDVVLHDLIWLQSDSSVDLTNAIGRARSKGLLRKCSNLFARADALDAALRGALAKSPFTSPPVRCVNELAALSGRDRRTVSTAWARFVGPAPAMRLKPVLDLVLLVRAVQLRHRGLRWPRIARELGVDLDVLRRKAKARLGRPLRDLSSRDGHEIICLLEFLVNASSARRGVCDELGTPGGGPAAQDSDGLVRNGLGAA